MLKQCVGPDLAATLTDLACRLHARKRAVQETCETILDVPLSLGSSSAVLLSSVVSFRKKGP